MDTEIRIVKLEGRVDRLDSVVFEGEGGVPSLIAAQVATAKKIDDLISKLDAIIAFRWPILIGIILIVLSVLSNEIGGPTIRHMLGVPEAHLALHQESELQSAHIPYLPPER
jgi:hypothetical protein